MRPDASFETAFRNVIFDYGVDDHVGFIIAGILGYGYGIRSIPRFRY